LPRADSVTPFQTLKYPRRDRLLPSRRFAIYTTVEAVHTSSIRSAFMAVGLGPLPTLHPVAGFELGIASAGIKRPGRKDVW
jgi:hypothetical protein